MSWTSVIDTSRIAAGGLADFATGLTSPSLRLGVTGLSRAGKTVFITALVHALLKQARLPVFETQSEGRILRAYLEPQPNDDLPRFAYEKHLEALTGENRHWPESTRQISQLRLTIEYAPESFFARNFSSGKLHVDIVDYPGEWLLDLPLMQQTYAQWSASVVALSRKSPRLELAKNWHAHLSTLQTDARADELQAVKAAELFTTYLASCRNRQASLSSLPPGRFLMPGDLEGSPLLSFAPLDVTPDQSFESGTLGALMERRYQSYVSHVVKPFYFGHFARLNRQIVLVDVMSALNAGVHAVGDLRSALTDILASFRLGSNDIVSNVFGKRIDKVLFAATKADLLHHTSHDRLQSILRLLASEAAQKAEFSGATYDALALSAIRATREATVTRKGEELPCIAGTPEKGEKIGSEVFDGATEAAIFPGDLPLHPQAALQGLSEGALQFVKFRPPLLTGETFPHIRLDRAVEFLLGDRFP
ncbi:YcjX family protein [Aestuariivirga litoralis]|uniref:YcjX family protein n=1 Tax=Aestuariivirga litoralis TaxID=2650924 RepID=UPI0018C6F1FB|nr:YcjX family protein [Aestuariivirga litoralis]MBG1233017.1 YcjX family protein [Aestuariivirga litoralis]